MEQVGPKKPQGNERKGCLPEQQIELGAAYYLLHFQGGLLFCPNYSKNGNKWV